MNLEEQWNTSQSQDDDSQPCLQFPPERSLHLTDGFNSLDV